MMTAFWQTWDE